MSGNWLNDLVEKREKESIGLKKVKNLLSKELYKKNAHFIYELLQNAEDASATSVSFLLNDEELIFMHNGRDFTKEDLESITDIDNSTKVSNINKIGKFGIGFKSVFAYTDTPMIYSGNYSFKIYDFVVPQKIESIKKEMNTTIMIFPFNSNEKKPDIAYQEIKKGLKDIADNTLLFLTNIKEINYIFDDSKNTIKRDEIDDIRITISNTKEKNKTDWLRFKKSIDMNNDNFFVSVAYQLRNENNQEKVIPIRGKVSIYFPAEKETSNLRFHIHAPFASTVSRDSIKDLDENDKLIEEIAFLAKETLLYLKDNNLLTIDFLGVLPNFDDNLSTFYEPIRKRIIEAFKENELLLTEYGEYKCVGDCLDSPKEIKKLFGWDILKELNVIDIDDISFIIDNIVKPKNVNYVKNASKDSRSDKFIQSLGVKKFGFQELLNALDEKGRNVEDWEDEYWINYGVTDEWLQKLYALLWDLYDKHNLDVKSYKIKYLIKTQDNRLWIDDSELYFKNKKYDIFHITLVKSEIYTLGDNTKEKEKARRFLEYMGVKEIDESQTLISLLLKYFNDNKEVAYDEHIEDVKFFMDYYERTGDTKVFQEYNFKLLVMDNNKKVYKIAKDVLLDVPYLETGMMILLKEGYFENKFLLSDIYQKLNREKFINFVKVLGVIYELEIFKCDMRPTKKLKFQKELNTKENRHSIIYDFYIKDLSKLLKMKNTEVSKIIWKTMNATIPDKLKAHYEPNKSKLLKPESLIIEWLKYLDWIPSKDGKFYKPQDISKDMLPDDFVYDNRNGWLDAIGFGENIRKSQKEYQEKKKIIQAETGFDPDILKELNKKGATNDDLIKLFEQIEKHKSETLQYDDELDIDVITDEKQYQTNFIEKVKEDIKQLNSEKQNEVIEEIVIVRKKSSSKTDKELRDKIKNFLYHNYKGCCQVCGFTFRKVNDQKNYFEMFNWDDKRVVKQKKSFITTADSLCLCRNCSANIKWGAFEPTFIDELKRIENFINKSIEEIKEVICKDIENNVVEKFKDGYEWDDIYALKIKLNNEDKHIYMTNEHLIQFITYLKLEEKNL